MSEQQTEQQTRPVRIKAIGDRLTRVDAVEKVTGRATYAVEHPGPEVTDPLHVWLVQSTIDKGRITGVASTAPLEPPGALPLTHHPTAPPLPTTSDRDPA